MQADYNPSLKAMSQLATAMHIPLAHLLIDEKQNMLPAPHGYKRVQAILPDFQAFKVQQWNDEALLKLKKIKWIFASKNTILLNHSIIESFYLKQL